MVRNRVLVTLGIVALTTATLVGMAGLASGAPDSFTTPLPRMGDAVLYNFTYGEARSGGIGASNSWHAQTDFFTGETESYHRQEASFSGQGWGGMVIWSWNGSMEMHDRDGRLWQAVGVDQVSLHHALEPARWALDGLPIAGERVGLAGDQYIGTLRGAQEPLFQFTFTTGPVLPTPATELHETEEHLAYMGSLAPCILRHGMQGTTVALDGAVELFVGCHDLDVALPTGVFQAQGVDALDIGQAVLFSQGDVRAWFAKDVPYPVRIDVPHGETVLHIELAEFIPGDGPVVPDGRILDGRTAPPIAMVPAKPWGMDDTGIDHPFPLHDAVQRALTDPVYSAFRDWAAAHPDWYAIRAVYTETDNTGDIDRDWEVAITDGTDLFALDVTQQVRPVGKDALRFLDIQGPPVTTYEFADGPTGGPDFTMDLDGAYPQSMPARLPSVASAVAAWQHVSTAPFSAYGHRLVCVDGDCNDVRAELLVGHSRDAQGRNTDDPTDPQGYFLASYRHDTSDLLLLQDGVVRERMVGASQEVPADESPPATTIGGAQVRTADIAALWGPPSKEATAGVGLVGVLVGVTYWAWPLLKAGALGMFSRIRSDQVLEHPARRRIHDEIAANPGIHFQELGRRLGGAHGSMHHHVRKLIDSGLVTVHEGNGFNCYFLRGQVDRRAMAAAPVLKSDTARRVLELVQGKPGISSGEAASRIGMSPSTLSYHVRRLENAGLISVQRDGRRSCLRATEAVALVYAS